MKEDIDVFEKLITIRFVSKSTRNKKVFMFWKLQLVLARN